MISFKANRFKRGAKNYAKTGVKYGAKATRVAMNILGIKLTPFNVGIMVLFAFFIGKKQ